MRKGRNINLQFHRLPSLSARFALGPPNPGTIIVAQETLDFRWSGFSPDFLLLMPTFALLTTPSQLTLNSSVR